MSKYDQLDYVSHYENINKTYPECVKDYSKQNALIPEELLQGITVEEFKRCLKLETDEDKLNFRFFNNNQIIINKDYLKNAKYISDEMSSEEKKEFLIDYLIFYFGDKINGDYFQNNLLDIFNLRNKNFDKNDFEFMIQKQFGKDEIDLSNDNDRNKFKKIINDDISLTGDYNNINNVNNSQENENNIINTKY